MGEALAVWSDPKRREVVKLRMAIEAAENLFDIDNKVGMYGGMTDKKLKAYRVHWSKRFKAFKDGV
jgi:hypothetical protein